MDSGEGCSLGQSSLLVGDGGVLSLFVGGGHVAIVVIGGQCRWGAGVQWSWVVIAVCGQWVVAPCSVTVLGRWAVVVVVVIVIACVPSWALGVIVGGGYWLGCPWLEGVVSGRWWLFSLAGMSLSICLGGFIDVASLTCHVVGCVLVRLVR